MNITQTAWQQLTAQPLRPSVDNCVDRSLNFALLEESGLIRFYGTDAGAFLQTQLTNDASLVTGQNSQITGYCNPKGRLLGLLHLIANGDDYIAITDKNMVPALIKRLRMFVMRSAVKIEDLSEEWAVAGVWGTGAEEFMRAADYSSTNSPNLSVHSSVHASVTAVCAGFSQPAYRLIGPHEPLAELLCSEPSSLTSSNQWRLQTVNAGQPGLYSVTAEAFIPQMINLDLIDGVSFQKGCYPGQEIVARTRYLGKLKKRMFLFEATGSEIAPGELIYTPGTDQSVGTVVDVATVGNNQSRLLAVVRITALLEPLKASGGATLSQLALPYPVPTEPAEN